MGKKKAANAGAHLLLDQQGASPAWRLTFFRA
jgi:hypothetical protein